MKALLRQCFFISIITEDFALKRTTNYALPDWEKSDFIQMSDFNALTHKLDTALKSHDDTLNTKADTSAVTAVQQEVAAAREANCLVKLAGPLVTTAANAAMEFDLSQVDMTKVAALFVVFGVWCLLVFFENRAREERGGWMLYLGVAGSAAFYMHSVVRFV